MFDTMTVTVSKTAEDGPVFHTVTLGTEHNTTSLIESISARAEAAGWEIVSVVVEYDSYWKEEMVTNHHKPTYFELSDFYDLICDNEHEVESILAYVTKFGFDVSDWEDNLKIQGDDKGDLAVEWLDNFSGKLYTEQYSRSSYSVEYVPAELPSYLSIDWDDTADNIAASEGLTITYLNGTYYMFS